MDQDFGLGTDCEGLCGPYKEEFGFLCLLFQDVPLLQATVEIEDMGPQVGEQLAYSFAILAILQYAFFPPITT